MTQRFTKIALFIFMCLSVYSYGQTSQVRTFGLSNKAIQDKEISISPIEEELNKKRVIHPITRSYGLFVRNDEFVLPESFSRQLVVTDKVQYLTIDQNVRRYLLEKKPQTLSITIPLASGEDLVVEMYAKNPFTEDFKVITDDGTIHRPSRQLHYRGVVEGYPGSLAGISIFEDEVIGVFSTAAHGQHNIAQLEDFEGVHAVYSDEIYPEGINVGCQDGIEIPRELEDEIEYEVRSRSHQDKCVNSYIETDFNLFLNKGSVTGVENYVTGLYNNVSILFQNEEINTAISEIFVWTTNDPYSNSVGTALSQFRSNRAGAFNGDIAHLFLLNGSGGGVAYLNVLCNPNWAFAVSNINSGFNNFPNYSWSIMVVSHEIGHNLGSNHTHWCGWPGGAIDNCFDTEGSCPPGAPPSGGGTIMSYCHLTSNGINFLNGFGPLPGNRIRQRVGQVNCLDSNCANSCQDFVLNATTIPTQCGLPNGELYLDIQGGEAPYLIDIGQGLTTEQNFFNLEPGTYQVTAYDATDCETSITVVIESSIGLDIDAQATATTCGETNGSILASVINSNGSVEYSIGFGVSLDPLFSDLPAGLYTLEAIDQNGCTFQQNVNVDFSEPITASAATTGTSCGLENGSAEITMAGGSGIFYFVNLNTGFGLNDNPVFENLAPGIYTAYVQDDIGCQMIFDFEISDSEPISVEVFVEDATCGQDNGSVSFDIDGGSGNGIEISVSGTNGAISEDDFNNLSPGTYNYIIADDLDCEVSGDFVIEDSEALGLSVVVVGTTCGLDNGSITASVSSTDAGNVSYELNGVQQTSPIFINLGIGTYTLTAISDNGCTETMEVQIQAVDALDAELVIEDALCGGLGQIEVIIADSQEYFYNIGQGNQTSPIFSNLVAGSYTIQVSDMNGCLGIVEADVNGTNSIAIDVNVNNTTCNEDNGGFEVSVTGGSGEYTYSYSDDEISGTSGDNLAPGTYQVTVIDSDGCVSTESFSISGSEDISTNAIVANTTCGLNNGSIEIDITSGLAPFTVDFGDGPQTGVFNASDLAAGQYVVTITDASQCSEVLNLTIDTSSPIQALVNLQGATCQNTNGGLTVTNVTGGNGNYAFKLGELTSEDGNFSNLSAGSYTLRITDDQGCIFNLNITIGNSGIPPTSDFSIVRNGLEVNLTNNSVGTNNTYQWSFGDGSTSNEFQPSPIYSASGIYQICLITTNSCGIDTLCRNISVFEAAQCRQQDSLVLVDLYTATDGANWNQVWDLSTPIDTWYGLEFFEDGCLGRIDLSNNNLFGFIPASLGNLSRIEVLRLGNNQLSQEIPEELSFLNFLEELDLSFNNLEASIPASLGDLSNLKIVRFQSNNLLGVIPAVLHRLTQLRHLDISDNELEGEIPERLMELVNLEYLNLGNNDLVGPVSNQLGMMSSLKYLFLHANSFTGSFPNSVNNLDSLRVLWIHSNQFTALPEIVLDNTWDDRSEAGIRIDNNRFTFKDIVYNMTLLGTLENVQYAPQAKVFKDSTVVVPLGEDLNLDIQVDNQVSDVIYKWYKNEAEVFQFSSSSLQIERVDEQMAGVYIGKLTHPLVPDLTLETFPIRVEVETSNAVHFWSSDRIEIAMFPNPVASGGLIYMECMSQVEETFSYQIIDVNGRILSHSGAINITKGINRHPINAPQVPGIYMIRLQSPSHDDVKNIKLIVH